MQYTPQYTHSKLLTEDFIDQIKSRLNPVKPKAFFLLFGGVEKAAK